MYKRLLLTLTLGAVSLTVASSDLNSCTADYKLAPKNVIDFINSELKSNSFLDLYSIKKIHGLKGGNCWFYDSINEWGGLDDSLTIPYCKSQKGLVRDNSKNETNGMWGEGVYLINHSDLQVERSRTKYSYWLPKIFIGRKYSNAPTGKNLKKAVANWVPFSGKYVHNNEYFYLSNAISFKQPNSSDTYFRYSITIMNLSVSDCKESRKEAERGSDFKIN